MKINKEIGELSDFCCKKMAQGTRPPGEFLTFQPQWKDHHSDLPHPAICLFKKGSRTFSYVTTDRAVPMGLSWQRLISVLLWETYRVPARSRAIWKTRRKSREVREG